jgi:S-adenosylmethionine hydrolase
VDISHDLPAHDVLAGALELSAAYKYFPAGTVFLVVVDPGVGSVRRGIAADAGDFLFVAPDNGVLTAVLDEHPPKRVVELTERRYARPTVSRTFEGRDRFAPAAAWLAKGLQLTSLGRPAGAITRLDIPKPRVGADGVDGEVLRVDRFGNLITNIDRRTFDTLAGQPLEIRIGSHQVSQVVSTYADAAPGIPRITAAPDPMAALARLPVTDTHTKNNSQATKYSPSVGPVTKSRSGMRRGAAFDCALSGMWLRANDTKSALTWGPGKARSLTSSDPMGV